VREDTVPTGRIRFHNAT